MPRFSIQLMLVLGLLSGGFSATRVSADEKQPVVEASKGPEGPQVVDREVKLTVGTWKDVEAVVSQSKGKVVIVDVWSTSCLPCMTEFPHLVELHNRYGDKVVCVSFSVDYVGIKSRPVSAYEKKVMAFLQKQNATCRNFLSSTPSDEVFETLDLASIPAAYIYGKDGKLLKRFDDSLLVDGKEEAFTYKDDIKPYVEKLLQNGQ